MNKIICIFLSIALFSIVSCRTAMHHFYRDWCKSLDVDLAIKQLIQEKEMYPKNWEIYYYISQCYLKKANLTKEDEYYEEAITAAKHAYELKKEAQAVIGLLYSYKCYGDKLFAENKFEESLKLYRAYVTLSEELISYDY